MVSRVAATLNAVPVENPASEGFGISGDGHYLALQVGFVADKWSPKITNVSQRAMNSIAEDKPQSTMCLYAQKWKVFVD